MSRVYVEKELGEDIKIIALSEKGVRMMRRAVIDLEWDKYDIDFTPNNIRKELEAFDANQIYVETSNKKTYLSSRALENSSALSICKDTIHYNIESLYMSDIDIVIYDNLAMDEPYFEY